MILFKKAPPCKRRGFELRFAWSTCSSLRSERKRLRKKPGSEPSCARQVGCCIEVCLAQMVGAMPQPVLRHFAGSKRRERDEPSLFFWCRKPGLNRYGTLVPRDFKSRASANSAIPATQVMIPHKASFVKSKPKIFF